MAEYRTGKSLLASTAVHSLLRRGVRCARRSDPAARRFTCCCCACVACADLASRLSFRSSSGLVECRLSHGGCPYVLLCPMVGRERAAMGCGDMHDGPGTPVHQLFCMGAGGAACAGCGLIPQSETPAGMGRICDCTAAAGRCLSAVMAC